MGFRPPPSSEPALPRVVQGGNLGATETLDLAGDPEVWLEGVLDANCTVTIPVAGLSNGAVALLLLTQDATGGRTLSVSDGVTPQLVAIPSAAGAAVAVRVYSPDGTDLYVDVAGGGEPGPADVTDGGSLGATETFSMASKDRGWLVGALDVNVVITLSDLAEGDEVVLVLTQDATGGRTVSVDDGSGAVSVPVDTEPSATTVVVVRYDGTDSSIVSSFGGTLVRQNTQTANYTLVANDAGKVVEMNLGTALTLTVPPNSSVAFPVGTVIEVAQLGAGVVTLAPGAGVTIRSRDSLLDIGNQYGSVSLRKRATDEWVAVGDLA